MNAACWRRCRKPPRWPATAAEAQSTRGYFYANHCVPKTAVPCVLQAWARGGGLRSVRWLNADAGRPIYGRRSLSNLVLHLHLNYVQMEYCTRFDK